jgi:hypothetical protein
MTKTPVGRMSEEDIEKVVLALVHEQLFTTDVCPPDMIPMVFMPIGFGALEDCDLDSVGAIYEYMDKRTENGVNGYPIFMSCQVAHVEDWKIIKERATAVRGAIDTALKAVKP